MQVVVVKKDEKKKPAQHLPTKYHKADTTPTWIKIRRELQNHSMEV